jgi:hypothetical protein
MKVFVRENHGTTDVQVPRFSKPGGLFTICWSSIAASTFVMPPRNLVNQVGFKILDSNLIIEITFNINLTIEDPL